MTLRHIFLVLLSGVAVLATAGCEAPRSRSHDGNGAATTTGSELPGEGGGAHAGHASAAMPGGQPAPSGYAAISSIPRARRRSG